MRNKFISMVLPLFAALSLSMTAAQAAEPTTAAPMSAPMMNKPTAAEPAMQAPMMDMAKQHQLDLNKADAATLQSQLMGIGKTRAEAIVAYREAHGPFATVDELLEIKGIGKALLERNRDKLKVE